MAKPISGGVCADCGESHQTGLEAMICGKEHGKPTPGLTESDRLVLIADAKRRG